MRRNDAMWRRLLRKTTRHMRRPVLEQVEDRLLLTTFTVKTTDDNRLDGAESSLRNAIIASNANPSTTSTPNQIQFAISSSGAVQTINLTAALPAITAPVVIDGFTEPNSSGTPLIAISGANIGVSGGDGFDVTAGNTTIRGLSIYGFANGSGIVLSGAGNDSIISNYIGVIPAGTSVIANGNSGIIVGAGADNSTIGGNVVAGNTGNGITVDGTNAGSDTTTVAGTKITGNKVGVGPDGATVLSNKTFGISVVSATGTVIGTPGVGNVVSGNYLGIYLGAGADTTTLQANLIGTGASGTTAVPNQTPTNSTTTSPLAGAGYGIYIDGATNIAIGGTTSGAGNTISGNGSVGIDVANTATTGLVIQGNSVGTSRGGGGRLGNNGAGIFLQGTGAVVRSNVVAGNTGDGIQVGAGPADADGNPSPGADVIQANYIGTNAAGAVLGNGGNGIDVVAGGGAIIGGALVNGAVTGTGNIIANNGFSGVLVAANGNTILSNSISNNGNLTNATPSLGIALTDGANNGIAAPTLTLAASVTNTSTFLVGFRGQPGTYTVQLFTTPQLDAAGNAEGATLIGTTTVNVTSSDFEGYQLRLPVGFEPGGYVTATFTDSAGNTSEFSPQALIGTGQGPNDVAPVVAVTSSATTVAAGVNVTYTFNITNPSVVTDRNVAFSATLPAGTSLFSGSATVLVFSNAAGGYVTAQVPVVVTNGVANVALGDFQPGQSSTVTLILTTGAASVPSYTLTGSVSVQIPTFDAVSASATTNVTASDDLYAFVNGPSDPIQVGQDATFVITVGNNGPSTGTNVQLLDTLPVGTTFVSATASNGATFTASNGQVTGNLGSIAGGQVVTIALVVAAGADTPATVTNTAAVSGDQPDSDTTNNVGVATATVIPSSDLALAEVAAPTAVTAGQQIIYTLTVTNNGPSPAGGVVLTDTLPAGLTFVSGSAAGGSVALVNGAVTAPVGNLAPGARSTVTFTVLATGSGALTDAASVASSGADPDPGNNTSSATVTVSPRIDLVVSLAGPTAPAIVGEPFVYRVTIINNGPSPATGVVLSDALFAGAQFLAATASNGAVGSASGGVVTVPIGSLAAGQSVLIDVAVNPSLTGSFATTASASAVEPEVNPANNSATVATTVNAPQFAIGFSAPTFFAAETAGFAAITLQRLGDQTGDVTVLFSTTAGGNAIPGVDYIPTTFLVTFPSGVDTQTVIVPVLPDPNDSTNKNVNLTVTSPSGQAIFGGGATSGSAALTIINTDPLLNGPTVTDVQIVGPANSITGVQLSTTGKLDPATATLASNFTFTSLTTGAVIPVTTVAYNAATGNLFLLPASPLPAGQIFTLTVNGTGPNAVADLAGNPLNSSLIGNIPGSNFALNIARGRTLTYTDQSGARVTLKISGPGVLDLNQATSGLLERLQVVGPTKATRLDGTVAGKARRITIGSVVGLKQFGTVKTGLPTPPFYVTNTIYPNLQTLNNGVASDILIGSSTTTTSKKGTKVKARSVGAAHPHAQAAHALHAASIAPKAAGRAAR